MKMRQLLDKFRYETSSMKFWKNKNKQKSITEEIKRPEPDIILVECLPMEEPNKDSLYLEFMLCMFAMVVIFLVMLSVVDDVRNDHLQKYHLNNIQIKQTNIVDSITK